MTSAAKPPAKPPFRCLVAVLAASLFYLLLPAATAVAAASSEDSDTALGVEQAFQWFGTRTSLVFVARRSGCATPMFAPRSLNEKTTQQLVAGLPTRTALARRKVTRCD